MSKRRRSLATTKGKDTSRRVNLYKYWWQEEEEKHLAEQYGMPYGEEVNDAQE